MLYIDYKESFDEHEADQSKQHKYHFTTVPCPMADTTNCVATEEITVYGADLFRYQSGKILIQDAFPYLTPAQRERLLTGICSSCYDGISAPPGEQSFRNKKEG